MKRQTGLIELGMLPSRRDLAQGRTEWVGKGGDWLRHMARHSRARVRTHGLLTQSSTLCTVSHNIECGAGSGGKESEEQESIRQIHVFETGATVGLRHDGEERQSRALMKGVKSRCHFRI